MRTKVNLIRAAAVAAIAIAMGTAALAADSLGTTASVDQSGMSAADHATAHATLPSVAADVIAALTGGSNPSTTVAQNSAHENDHASTTDHHAATSTTTTTTDQDTDNETETDNDVSKGQEVGNTATSGTKPGFGCGDTNHKHSGPRGRPGATEPPGCARAHD